MHGAKEGKWSYSVEQIPGRWMCQESGISTVQHHSVQSRPK